MTFVNGISIIVACASYFSPSLSFLWKERRRKKKYATVYFAFYAPHAFELLTTKEEKKKNGMHAERVSSRAGRSLTGLCDANSPATERKNSLR